MLSMPQPVVSALALDSAVDPARSVVCAYRPGSSVFVSAPQQSCTGDTLRSSFKLSFLSCMCPLGPWHVRDGVEIGIEPFDGRCTYPLRLSSHFPRSGAVAIGQY